MHYIRRTTPGTPPLASMKLSVSLISLVLSTTLCAAARVASPQCAVAGAVLRVHDHNAAPAAPGQTPLSSSLMVAAQTCTSPPILSCSPDADDADTCCVVSPGGALVHTQFWDVGFGVANSFGIHGLWPDTCAGKFYENCDSGRAYPPSTISAQLPDDLRSYMETYWVSNDDSPEEFWAHEWKTHGTCVSTLEPSCFSDYTSAAEVAPYFATVVGLFKQLDLYSALAAAGITPSSDQTYAVADMQAAIQSSTGYTPDLVCKRGVLSSVQFYLNAQGPLQNGVFVQGTPTRKSNCPAQVSWPPKTV